MNTSPFLDNFLALKRVGALAPSPCGRYVVCAVQRLDAEDEARFVSDLWRVSLEDPHAAPQQLTYGEYNDRAPAFRRDGALAFLSDRKLVGDKSEGKRSQVWLLPGHGGEAQPLTDEPLGVTGFRFAAEADVLVVSVDVLPDVPHDEQRKTAETRRKSGPSGLHYTQFPIRFWDHWIGRTANHLVVYDQDGERRDVTPDAGRYDLFGASWDVSPDGKRVVVSEFYTDDDRLGSNVLCVIDLATNTSRRIERLPSTSYSALQFAPDSTTVALCSMTRSRGSCGKLKLRLFNTETLGLSDDIAEAQDMWFAPVCWAEDGQTLFVTANDHGDNPVFAVQIATGDVQRLTGEGSYSGVQTTQNNALVGIRSRFFHPPEPVFIQGPDAAEREEPRLLACLSGFPQEEGRARAVVERHETPGAGGTPVQYFVVKSPEASGAQPVVLWIHGGPMGQWADTWHWRWNVLALIEKGYTMVLPNPRGSTGFGQDFVEGIWGGRWGAECYDDLLCVLDAVCERDDIDATRLAAMGGSFGGYMTNWMGVKQNERFKALVTHASVYDFKAFYGTTDFPAFFALQLGGGAYDDVERFTTHSPSRYVSNWTTPTLIIHGDKDYRVPIGEALALFEALQAHNVESELLVFPDENHWILKPNNIQLWYESVLTFLAKHM